MPGLTIKVKTSVNREQFIAALTDFGPERGSVWGNSQSSHLVVHESGNDTADVTEGSKIFGGVWERLRYDWSDHEVIKLHTIESNVWARGSGWHYEIKESEDGSGSLITATVTRYPNSKRGYLILFIFGSIARPLIKRGFRQTIRAIERKARDDRYDAIILPGGGVGLDGTLPDAAKDVLKTAAELYEAGSAGAIIVCGRYGYKAIEKPKITEAQAYANYLEGLGVPKQAIFLETKSQDTLGNILFAKMHILLKQQWHKLLVIPAINQSNDRINYLFQKILGNEYSWDILRVGENKDPSNLDREARSLKHTKIINDEFTDGDHEGIYKGLIKTHPAYGGTKWTIDELRKELGS